MPRLLAIVCTALAVLSAPALANPDIAKRYLPNAQKVGAGVLTYLFWDVYRATLYAPKAGWRRDAPFALTLAYMRDLKGRDIAERTISEIRGQGYDDEQKLAAWFDRLAELFPDVGDGDSLTAVRDTDARTVFYRGSLRIGTIEDPVFTARFFDIWLGDKTSEPKLRRALLGGQG
jgi:hypothetical protein